MRNQYKVQKKQWHKWSRSAQFVFNELYSAMLNQRVISPHNVPIKEWDVIRWNTAWLAASAVNDI